MLLRGPIDRYNTRTPVPADVVLLAEVADSSYAVDAGNYLREYAAAGIAQYWTVNIPERRVEVYTGPNRGADGAAGYRGRKDYALGETVPLAVEGGGAPSPRKGCRSGRSSASTA
jgi:Putative restriction endonuclease